MILIPSAVTTPLERFLKYDKWCEGDTEQQKLERKEKKWLQPFELIPQAPRPPPNKDSGAWGHAISNLLSEPGCPLRSAEIHRRLKRHL